MTLPPGWVKAALSDLISPDGVFTDGDWVESKDQDPTGDVRLIQLADIGDGVYRNRSARFLTRDTAERLNCTYLSRGDLLIARMPDPLGRACLFPGDSKPSVTVVDVCVLRPGVFGPDPQWLMHAVNSPAFRSAVAAKQSGSTRKRISRRNLASLKLLVPPLSEQRRIAMAIEEHLSRLDAAVTGLTHVRSLIPVYRAAVLRTAIAGKLVETEAAIAARYSRSYETGKDFLQSLEPAVSFARPRSPWLPAIPVDWVWGTLRELGRLERGKSTHRPRDDAKLYSGAYPFIQTGDVKRSGGRITAWSQTYSEFGLSQSRLWPAGTLCITIAANIAETGILTFPACFPDSVVGFVQERSPITVRFVELFLRTAKDNLNRFAPATAQKNINLRILSDLAVPVPPLAEQKRIVDEVDRLFSFADSIEHEIAIQLARCVSLRESILQHGIEGKLVPQDPADEPAVALLDRIRAKSFSSTPARIRTRKSA